MRIDVGVTDGAEIHVELIGIDPGAPEGDMAVEALVNTGTGKIVDFTVLESRVAQAEQGYASAVASVGTTAADLAFADRIGKEMAEAKEAMVAAAAIDFAALESRVAQAEQGYAAAVSSVGTTADELREARAALREARGG